MVIETVYIESTVVSVGAIVEVVNDEKGYDTPVICTPEELMEV